MSPTRSLLLGTASLAVSLLGADLSGFDQARAATLTETLLDTGTHTTEYPTNGFGSLGFQLFDSNLGTLTSVAVTVTGYLNGTGSVMNTSASPGSTTYSKVSAITLSSSGLGALVSALNALNSAKGLKIFTNSASFTLGPNGGPSDTISVGPLSGSASHAFNFTSSLAQFEAAGGGTVGLTVNTQTKDTFQAQGGAFSTNVVTTDQVTISTTFTYTAAEQDVPEPGSMMLLGTGLLGLGAATRRKRWHWPQWLRGRSGDTDRV